MAAIMSADGRLRAEDRTSALRIRNLSPKFDTVLCCTARWQYRERSPGERRSSGACTSALVHDVRYLFSISFTMLMRERLVRLLPVLG